MNSRVTAVKRQMAQRVLAGTAARDGGLGGCWRDCHSSKGMAHLHWQGRQPREPTSHHSGPYREQPRRAGVFHRINGGCDRGKWSDESIAVLAQRRGEIHCQERIIFDDHDAHSAEQRIGEDQSVDRRVCKLSGSASDQASMRAGVTSLSPVPRVCIGDAACGIPRDKIRPANRTRCRPLGSWRLAGRNGRAGAAPAARFWRADGAIANRIRKREWREGAASSPRHAPCRSSVTNARNGP